MLLIVLALFFGTFSGTVAGVLMSWWWLAQMHRETEPLEHAAVDPDMDDQINQAAARWAEAHGRPEAAPLVADKLRLVHALSQKRVQRHGAGWSR